MNTKFKMIAIGNVTVSGAEYAPGGVFDARTQDSFDYLLKHGAARKYEGQQEDRIPAADTVTGNAENPAKGTTNDSSRSGGSDAGAVGGILRRKRGG